jgi:hypothetical protein
MSEKTEGEKVMDPNATTANGYPMAVLNPNSGEVALNMKQLVEDNSADSRRRVSMNGGNDQAWQSFNLSVAQDNQTVKHLATLGLVQAGQSGFTENQQTVSPVRTATGDAIVGGVGVSAEQVAANVANITTLTTAIITQTLAAVLPVLINAIGGASTPSQTQPKPTVAS